MQKPAPDSKRQDAETEAILYQGASISQLGKLFGMDNRNVKEALFGIQPVGTRAGNPIYRVRDAAPRLCQIDIDPDELIKRMTTASLPVSLQKEFWAGMRSRQLYEQAAGELWPTEQVREVVTELVKTMKVSLLLTRDTVERESELTARQRQIIVDLVDSALGEMHGAVVAKFSARKPATQAAEDPFDDGEL